MNKDIRNLISEAFDELYSEIVNEAPRKQPFVRKTKIEDADIEPMIQKAISKGTPVPYLFPLEDSKSQANFEKIIDAIAVDYKNTGNPNSKAALQSTFYPTSGSRFQHAAGGNFFNNPDYEDAIASAYEQIVINNFDETLNAYKPGTSLTSMFTNLMKNRVNNYITKGYRGADGGSKYDAIGGQEKSLSMDQPLGGDGDAKLGDKIGDDGGEGDGNIGLNDKSISNLGIGPESAEELGKSIEQETSRLQNILKDTIAYLDNTFEENEDENGKRGMVAFKGMIAGDSREEIFEDNPGLFKEPRYVSIYFDRLINGPEAAEVSKMMSDIHGIDFDISKIDPKKLKQQSAQSRGHGGFSKIVKIATPEMQTAQKELNDALAVVGLKGTDFNSTKTKEQVVSKLQAAGKFDELENILDAEDNLNQATEKAKSRGEYDVDTPLLPSSPEEEMQAGQMFEGVNIDALMERVYKRLMK